MKQIIVKSKETNCGRGSDPELTKFLFLGMDSSSSAIIPVDGLTSLSNTEKELESNRISATTTKNNNNETTKINESLNPVQTNEQNGKTSDTEQQLKKKPRQRNHSDPTNNDKLFSPFYENLQLANLTPLLEGNFHHFTLPRPQIRSGPWSDNPEYLSSSSGGESRESVTSTLELIRNTSPTPTNSIPNQICTLPVPIYNMNNYPYQNSTSTIYHNPYSYSSSHASSIRDDIPYASIKHNGTRIKVRHDNVSPATSNITASTALSSSRSTLKRQQQQKSNGSGEFIPNGNGTLLRNGGTMSRSARAANASTLFYTPTHDHLVVPVPVTACQGNAFCSGCNGPVHLPLAVNHLETIPEMCSLKTDPPIWHFNNNNNNNVHIPLKRNSSIGGFTLNGQPRHMKKSKMSRFCSSHKIALVVSTFSLLVTLGIAITLILMKKKGMMEGM